MPEHGRDFPDKARHPSRQVHRGRYSGFGYGPRPEGVEYYGDNLGWLDRNADSRAEEFDNGIDDVEVDTSGGPAEGGE